MEEKLNVKRIIFVAILIIHSSLTSGNSTQRLEGKIKSVKTKSKLLIDKIVEIFHIDLFRKYFINEF